jgi:hypothetical protein
MNTFDLKPIFQIVEVHVIFAKGKYKPMEQECVQNSSHV